MGTHLDGTGDGERRPGSQSTDQHEGIEPVAHGSDRDPGTAHTRSHSHTTPERVVTEATLNRGGRLLLLRVRRHQRRVHIEHHHITKVGSATLLAGRTGNYAQT